MSKYWAFFLVCLFLLPIEVQGQTIALFNGKNLEGWQGDPQHWSVVDGAIQGQTQTDGQLKSNTFLIYEKPFANFELSLKYKIISGNSGIQYRARIADANRYRVVGYQADVDSGPAVSGILYEEGGRGILAMRGQRAVIHGDGTKKLTQFADAKSLQQSIRTSDWNDYRVVANGQRLQHFINGKLMTEVNDAQVGKRADSGVIALQLHAGPAMKVFYKDINIRVLRGNAISTTSSATPAKTKKANQKSPALQTLAEPLPKWIWHRDPQEVESAVFRKTFRAKAGQKLIVRGTCDNEMSLFLNGKLIGGSSRWEQPIGLDATDKLVAGTNELRVEAKDHGGIAALALSVKVGDQTFVTDTSWQSATLEEAKANKWGKPVVIGTVGDSNLPWRGITAKSFGQSQPVARPIKPNQTAQPVELHLPEGFKAELVYSVPKPTQGSWVSITKDPQGRLYTSDQGRKGMYRITPAPIGDSAAFTKVEKLNVQVSGAQGMCWAHNSLYVNAYGSGVWRLQDTDGDDQLDQATNIVPIANGGEHGMHAVIESPDGKGICFLAGNHSPPPKFNTSTIPTNWSEDLLLPRNWDPRGHARGKLAPGGWIARSNPDGTDIQILSVGYRNQYDIALNRNGEMFTYDADMEWDTGTPWYRPTRVCHVTSGSEFGWRSGSGKWPAYFEDSVPPVVEIGPGSPTGVVFGTGARFPARYQDALFILDWTFGTIYAIHFQPDGASYKATKETFAWSKPLPVTDAIVGGDGALYFTVGGRGTDSALYRVWYDGDESTELVSGPINDSGKQARTQRRQLEALHNTNPQAVSIAWPHLSSDDRALRYAARIAIENQPVDTWRHLALKESNPQASVIAMIALARQGIQDDLPLILNTLAKLNLSNMTKGQRLGALRAWSLAFSRMGQPTSEWREKVISKLDAVFPTGDDQVDTELARLLVFLESENVVSKSIEQIKNPKPTTLPDWAELAKRNDNYGRSISNMLADMPPLQSIQYAFMLRNAKKGWTPETRKSYFQFFVDVSKKPGGPSYAGYLTKARNDAMSTLNLNEKSQLADLLGRPLVAPAVQFTPPKGPGRKWTTDQAVAAVGSNLKQRDFASGKNLFHALSCSKCHYFAGGGGAIGPDLTSVANKFSTRDLVEAIVEPSKVISDQYGSKTVLDLDGRVATGLVVEEGDTIKVYLNDASQPPVVFQKDNIDTIEESNASQMPEKLLDQISEEELKDLIAYLKSGGNGRSPMFKRK